MHEIASITIFRILPHFQLDIPVQFIVKRPLGLPSMFLIQVWFCWLFPEFLLIITSVLTSRFCWKKETKRMQLSLCSAINFSQTIPCKVARAVAISNLLEYTVFSKYFWMASHWKNNSSWHRQETAQRAKASTCLLSAFAMYSPFAFADCFLTSFTRNQSFWEWAKIMLRLKY